MVNMRSFKVNFYHLVVFCGLVSGSVFAYYYHQAQALEIPPQEKIVIAWPLVGRTIVLDAGHGGFDPGATTADGLEEKTINLEITLKLAALLREAGMQVVLTRDQDVALAHTKKEDMAARVQIAKNSGCDLLLSIQANKFSTASERGCQVFYHPKDAASKMLANSIQEEMRRLLKNTRRKSLSLADSYLLRNLSMPSAIVEVGFLSHPQEAALLADGFYQAEVAWSIYSGILQYFAAQEEKISP